MGAGNFGQKNVKKIRGLRPRIFRSKKFEVKNLFRI